MTSSDFQPNQLLGGRYRVIEVIDRGGMGVVYKVEQIFLGKELALKTISQKAVSDMSLRRFQAEARAAFAVNHPNVTAVHDFGLLDDNVPFLAMELVKGQTLASLLKHRTLTLDEALPIFIQVCHGLTHAHEHNVVHRDIKPSNIMLVDELPPGTEGSVKILDFGIAKLVQIESDDRQSLTQTGEIFGSPLYMSPEQCAGAAVDHRTDIYSFGCVIFEALTGTTPFVGDSSLSTMMMHQSSTIPALKEASLGTNFPTELEQVIQAMLAKRPQDRIQSLAEVAHDLGAISRGETLHRQFHAAAAGSEASSKSKSKSKMFTIRKDMLAAAVIGTFFTSATLGWALSNALLATRKHKGVESSENAFPFKITDLNKLADEKKQERACRFIEKLAASDNSLKLFKGYKDLQLVSLDMCTVSDQGLESLLDSKLLFLSLSDCFIVKTDNIAKMKTLDSLYLRKSDIDDDALKNIAKLPNLRTLDLRNCTSITDKGLLSLSSSTSLRNVLLSPGFSRSTIEYLHNKMPQCSFEGYINKNLLTQLEPTLTAKTREEKLEQLIAAAEKINPDTAVIAVYLNDMAIHKCHEHKFAEAEKLIGKALKIAERTGNLTLQADSLGSGTVLALMQNRLADYDSLCNKSSALRFDTLMHDEPELMNHIDALTNHPAGSTAYDNIIANSKRAVEYIKLYPERTATFLPLFLEKIGRMYYYKKMNREAESYLKESIDLYRQRKDTDGVLYARGLIELARVVANDKYRIALVDEGLDQLDKLGHPSKLNMRELYCDGCAECCAAYWRAGKMDAALKYAERGLTMAKSLKVDIDKRVLFFQQLIERVKKVKAKS